MELRAEVNTGLQEAYKQSRSSNFSIRGGREHKEEGRVKDVPFQSIKICEVLICTAPKSRAFLGLWEFHIRTEKIRHI
ncbi:Dna-Binding Protein Rfx5 [Manis pentadactyla]|nr:Dna-Binding Protein Rfx5 [Manis pentadactyla]